MFRGSSTRSLYETCLKRGLCEKHADELDSHKGKDVDNYDFCRKAILFVRVQILNPIIFNKPGQCEKIWILMGKTKHFSYNFSNRNLPDDAFENIYVLDSIIVFTMCYLSKICCFGALFNSKIKYSSDDPDIKFLANLVHVDKLQENDISSLCPLLQEKFSECDIDLIKICYASTLLFIRNICTKLKIENAVQNMERDLLDSSNIAGNQNIIADGITRVTSEKDKIAFLSVGLQFRTPYNSELFLLRGRSYQVQKMYQPALLDVYISAMLAPLCETYKVMCSILGQLKEFQRIQLITVDTNSYCKDSSSCEHCRVLLKMLECALEGKTVDQGEVPAVTIKKKQHAEDDNNLPELIEASDSSDSDGEAASEKKNDNFPELIEASDSSESDDEFSIEKETEETKSISSITPTKVKKNKAKQKKIKVTEIQPQVETEDCIDFDTINIYLKEASQALLEDCGYKALQIFCGKLKRVIEVPEAFPFNETEIVCIKYSYGLAYCQSGGYDDLQKSIVILKEILEKHESVPFAAAYYALGLACRKLNRFKDALLYLKTVKSMLEKGIRFKVYPWPSHTSVINETKSKVLEELVDSLIKECENPPNPDAMCRYSECNFQPPIYYSDPDFKGYISIFCSDQCCLQYHLQCWKLMKIEKELTEKEFLERPCFTPDCDGVLIKVQSIDRKGDVSREFLSEVKKGPKTKWAKWEKKADAKQDKKRKRDMRSRSESVSKDDESEKAGSRKNSDATECSISSVESSASAVVNTQKRETPIRENILKDSFVNKVTDSPGTKVTDPPVTKVTDHPVTKVADHPLPKVTDDTSYASYNGDITSKIKIQEKPVPVCTVPEVPLSEKKELESNEIHQTEVPKSTSPDCIKKNTYLQLIQSTKVSPTTEKSESGVTEIQSKNSNTENSDNLKYTLTLKPPQTSISEISASKKIPEARTDEIQPNDSKAELSECIRNNLYSYLSDFLLLNGPQKFDSPLLLKEMASFPKDATEVITNAGGIGNFLKEDLRFAFVKNTYVCVISDLGRAYKLCSNPTLLSDDELDDYPQYSNCDIDSEIDFSQPNFGLNPHATEYKPANDENNMKQLSATSSSNLLKYFNSEPRKSVSPLSIKPQTAENTNETSDKNSGKIKEHSNDSETSSCPNKGKKRSLSGEFVQSQDIPSSLDIQKYPSDNLANDADDLAIKLRALLGVYFSKDMEKQRDIIDSFLSPFVIKRSTNEETGTGDQIILDLKSKIEVLKLSQNQLNVEIAVLSEKKNLLQKQLNSVQQQKSSLQQDVVDLNNKVTDVLKEKEDLKKKYTVEMTEIQESRKFLLESFTDSLQTIDKQKDEIKLLLSGNKNLNKIIEELKDSLKSNGEKLTNCSNEEKKYKSQIKSLQAENTALKEKLQKSDLRILHLKKTEYLKKIEEKSYEASKRQKELQDGLMLMNFNLSPMVQANMKTLSSQLATYIDELAAIKLDFIFNIDDQIERVQKGESLADLPNLQMKIIPNLPTFENLCTVPTAGFNNSNLISSKTISSQYSLSTASLPPPGLYSNIAPSVKPIVPTVPTPPMLPAVSAPIVQPPILQPKRTGKMENTTEPLNLQNFDSNVQESFKSGMASFNSFASAPMPTPQHSLDNIIDKTFDFKPPSTTIVPSCESFQPASSSVLDPMLPVKTPLLETPLPKKTPLLETPSIKTPLLATPLPKSSLFETPLPKAPLLELSTIKEEKSFSGLDSIPKTSTTPEPKKPPSNNYEKLLKKLQEKFPTYTLEELMCYVKEFRKQRQGKLSGLPIDTIISQIGAIINAKRANEKKVAESKAMATKTLVNKKLVPDPKAKEEPCASTKKKTAWKVDPDTKKPFLGNCDECCVICYEDMINDSYKVTCGHMFHEKCIKQWLLKKSDCPVCRVLLLLPEDYPSLS